MNRYEIRCTEEQTKKALELGAPVMSYENAITRRDIPHFKIGNDSNWTLYFIPTAEEMISWLEEQEGIDNIVIAKPYRWVYTIGNESIYHTNGGYYSSRREATIAAIDAALEYLSNVCKR